MKHAKVTSIAVLQSVKPFFSQAAPAPSPSLLALRAGIVSGSAEVSDGALGISARLLLGPLKDAALWQFASAEVPLQHVAADEGLSMQQLVSCCTVHTCGRQNIGAPRLPWLLRLGPAEAAEAPASKLDRPTSGSCRKPSAGSERAERCTPPSWPKLTDRRHSDRSAIGCGWDCQQQHGSICHADALGQRHASVRADAHAQAATVLSCGAGIEIRPAVGGPIGMVTVLHASSRTEPRVTLGVRERSRHAPLWVAASATARKLRRVQDARRQ